MEYVFDMPEAVPAGKVLVHNHVRPTVRLGFAGFRAWLDDPDDGYEVCTCGWAPHLVHYRVRCDAYSRQKFLNRFGARAV
jgi:hypothetical protein